MVACREFDYIVSWKSRGAAGYRRLVMRLWFVLRTIMPDGPMFDEAFRKQFEDLLKWRRDVRNFRTDPVDAQLIGYLIGLSSLAPSVGYSQPWRFVLIESPECRESVRANFENCNRQALSSYSGAKAQLYATLKLAGLRDAPVHLAVFLSENTEHGSGLGRTTMPETLEYSTVLAVYTLWLAARSYGLGVGWVSILNPLEISRDLRVPNDWKLIAYLCIGYPKEGSSTPELLRHEWEDKLPVTDILLKR
jgi:5,6-dimethylbenzimidazole synthase